MADSNIPAPQDNASADVRDCPVCGAKPGEPCIVTRSASTAVGRGQTMTGFHRERGDIPPASADVRGLVEELRGLITDAEQDAIDDANAAIDSGERTDLWEYEVEITLGTAKRILAALSHPSPTADAGDAS